MPVQGCLDDGSEGVEVPSHTIPGLTYCVDVGDLDDLEEVICECEGYLYRGYCSHQLEAIERVCGWYEPVGPETQTLTEKHNKICPRCGGPTEWLMDFS